MISVGVSRAELFSENNTPEADRNLVAQLYGLIQNSWTLPTPQSRSKRRKTEESPEDNPGFHESIPFRLVSTSLPPKPISLAAKPPPDVVVVTKEPDNEDDAAAAERRMSQAQDVAVDYAWIIKESKKPSVPLSNTQKKLIHVRAPAFDFASMTTAPAIIRTQKDQLGRVTRPPVPPSELLYPPYCSKGHRPSGVLRSRCFTHLDVNTLATDHATKHEKRRQRRGVKKAKVQPVFWRPNSAWGGKSAGYAVGYPSNWAAYEDDGGRYRRDSMRKGMHIDSL